MKTFYRKSKPSRDILNRNVLKFIEIKKNQSFEYLFRPQNWLLGDLKILISWSTTLKYLIGPQQTTLFGYSYYFATTMDLSY